MQKQPYEQGGEPADSAYSCPNGKWLCLLFGESVMKKGQNEY
jgi:hypothetical protein